MTGTPLADWPIGRAGMVVGLGEDRAFAARLAHLGVRVGMVVTPMLRTPGRGLVLSAGELRLALDRGSTRAVLLSERPGRG